MSSVLQTKRIWRHLKVALGWTRSSTYLMSLFLATLLMIVVVWWPLVEEYVATYDSRYPWWVQFDWLLLGIFAAMSLLIMAGADLRADALLVLVAFVGGLVIESWGTQTEIWTYYTLERPPLWILPAWPIAGLSIDRLVRISNRLLPELSPALARSLYWSLFLPFYGLMLFFVWPMVHQSLTMMSLLLCTLLIATPTDCRLAALTFVAGAALGYFLELWGTTRACWTYYTQQTPPLFAVLAHGMAAVAFWRAKLLLERVAGRLRGRVSGRRRLPLELSREPDAKGSPVRCADDGV